jgi:hypothetical protein
VNVTTKYTNQLQASSLLWVQPFALCVPTYKYSGAGLSEGAAPKGYTHLLVYGYQVTMGSIHGVVFKNPVRMTTVKIVAQFYPSGFTTTLGNPYVLLTPTKKVYAKPRTVTPMAIGSGTRSSHNPPSSNRATMSTSSIKTRLSPTSQTG